MLDKEAVGVVYWGYWRFIMTSIAFESTVRDNVIEVPGEWAFNNTPVLVTLISPLPEGFERPPQPRWENDCPREWGLF
jgi:hypothetical protein